jgi:TetR/AcrR family transcriptional regulator, tetracycline repressor protein
MKGQVRRAKSKEGERSPRQRTPRGTVNRERVVGAALRAIEGGRYESMTIRSIAAELGVAPMTIYRHVRSRDELLDDVADVVLARNWRPKTDHEDWRPWLVGATTRFRQILADYPAVLNVYLRHPVDSPAAIARMQEMIAHLISAGFDERGAVEAYAALHTYTIGFAALEASRSHWFAERDETPNAVKDQLASFTTREQFTTGLNFILDGFEHVLLTKSDKFDGARH